MNEPLDALPEPIKVPVEGRDFYLEDGLLVMTAEYLLARGYCCENGCRNCPYEKDCPL